MTSTSPAVTLNDGQAMPQLGLGVWQATNDQSRAAVRAALDCGYRSIDTAAIYGNEEGVGAGVADAGLARGDVFITTKVWNADQGYDAARRALEQSLQRLKLDYVDLLLIHWPVPQNDRYLDTWRALIESQKDGLVRSIGVSNFSAAHLGRLIAETGVKPVLNQIELHPFMQQTTLRAAHTALGIQTESWSPLAQGRIVDDATIATIAKKHGKSAAQVVIRWHLDSGLVVIPKSVTLDRIRANADVFDFTLDAEDMAAFALLNRDQRLGPDPEVFGG